MTLHDQWLKFKNFNICQQDIRYGSLEKKINEDKNEKLLKPQNHTCKHVSFLYSFTFELILRNSIN